MGTLVAHQQARAARATYLPHATISEKPSAPLISALGGAPSLAGVTVTEETAQGIPVVYACNKVLSQDVAKTPIKLKRRMPDKSRRDDPDHPVYVALHDLPNPAMSAYEFKEVMQTWLNLWGNAYAEIVRKRTAIELWPLEPWRMTVELSGGLLTYRYGSGTSVGTPKTWTFDPANPPIFHLRQNASPWYCGRGPVQMLREAMGVALARDHYIARFYGQGGHPRIALSTSAKLSPEAARRVRTDIEALTTGEANWHRAIVMDHDLKPVPLVMPHKDAQFVEEFKLGRSILGGTFRVPAHKINDLEKATFSNVEHLAIEYVTDSLMPHFVCWQQAIARDLLNPKSFNTHFAVFVVDALVRGDFKTLNEALHMQRQDGVINANEWRRIIDMDDQVSDEDGGNLYLVNGTMQPMRRDPAALLESPLPVPPGGAN